MFNLSFDLTPPVYVLEAAVFFREATEKHKEGEHLQAIDLFNKGVHIYRSSSAVPSDDILVRLPNYLKALGRTHEAWGEYPKILNAYDDYKEIIRPMIFSKVYDKMRLFQQREKNHEMAAVYAALSYVAWHKGLLLQNRHEELEGWSLNENIEYGLRSVYTKLPLDFQQQIKNKILAIRKTLAQTNLWNLEKELLQVV